MNLPAYAMNVTSFPEMYERWLVGPLFQPWAETLLDRVRPDPGDCVLDVGCGTGIVARLARQRVGSTGKVVGVDLSPQMLEVAAKAAADVEWRQGNAGALPAASGESFDVVVCHQGLQFFPDKRAAVREMRRVMRSGGRLGIATWRSLGENPFFQELYAIAERHLGSFVDARHGYGDAEEIRQLLAGNGFSDVHVDVSSKTSRFADPDLFLRLNTNALVGMSPASKSMNDDERARTAALIAMESSSVLSRYTDGEGLVFDLTSNVATARG